MNKAAKTVAVVCALTAGAGAALAAPSSHEAVGKIERINTKSQHLTVNHRSYRYTSPAMAQNLKPGEKVKVHYRWERGHRVADKIAPVNS